MPPLGPSYCSLPKRTTLTPGTAQADIRFSIGCNHHVVCYLSMLDYAETKAALTPVPAAEATSYACVIGPKKEGVASIAKSMFGRVLEAAASGG